LKVHDETIQSIYGLWFECYKGNSWKTYTNLYSLTKGLIRFFNDKGEFDDLLDHLQKVYFNPVKELQSKYPSFVLSKNAIEWDIPKLEYIGFRESYKGSKLGEEYYLDDRTALKKRLLFGEIMSILSLFKQELFDEVIHIMLTKNIKLNLNFETDEPSEPFKMGGKF
jgi:hypothetical protein